jgi:hypothetical protein
MVQAAVRRSFPEPVWQEAFDTLPSPGQFRSEVAVDRVLLAVVALASGDLEALKHYSGRALADWRDVLYWHEHPREPDEPTSWEELRKRLGLPDGS